MTITQKTDPTIDIIELIKWCEDGVTLKEFYEEVMDAFEGDSSFQNYSQFERLVIIHNFDLKLSQLINTN